RVLRTLLCLANPSGMQAARWRAASSQKSPEDSSVPGESERHASREVESCFITKRVLRTLLCLANPSGMQAARWRAASSQKSPEDSSVPGESERHGSPEVESCFITKRVLRTLQCLANPSGMQAARWRAASSQKSPEDSSVPGESERHASREVESCFITKRVLRTLLCLANPSGMQAARWRAASSQKSPEDSSVPGESE